MGCACWVDGQTHRTSSEHPEADEPVYVTPEGMGGAAPKSTVDATAGGGVGHEERKNKSAFVRVVQGGLPGLGRNR